MTTSKSDKLCGEKSSPENEVEVRSTSKAKSQLISNEPNTYMAEGEQEDECQIKVTSTLRVKFSFPMEDI